jgi:hypothetical protein
MKLHESLEWNPLERRFEHVVSLNLEDQARANYERAKDTDGFALRSEAKEKYEIPMELLVDPVVRIYVDTFDKTAEKRMLEKYPWVKCSGQKTNRVFLGGENIAPSD